MACTHINPCLFLCFVWQDIFKCHVIIISYIKLQLFFFFFYLKLDFSVNFWYFAVPIQVFFVKLIDWLFNVIHVSKISSVLMVHFQTIHGIVKKMALRDGGYHHIRLPQKNTIHLYYKFDRKMLPCNRLPSTSTNKL